MAEEQVEESGRMIWEDLPFQTSSASVLCAKLGR
jgi:hypothetical protein